MLVSHKVLAKGLDLPLLPQLPEAWLLLASAVVPLALVPLKNHIIDPFLARRKLFHSALQQMTLGMFFSLTSILTAGRT